MAAVDHNGILIFSDPFFISVLEVSKFWLADRRFILSPTNNQTNYYSYQIYTLHENFLGITSACSYAILQNKTENTYSRLLIALETFAPDCKPDKFLLDFELASTSFPKAPSNFNAIGVQF